MCRHSSGKVGYGYAYQICKLDISSLLSLIWLLDLLLHIYHSFFLVSYFSVTDISCKKMWRKSRNRKREEYKKEAHEISTLRSYYCVKKKVNMNALAGCER